MILLHSSLLQLLLLTSLYCCCSCEAIIDHKQDKRGFRLGKKVHLAKSQHNNELSYENIQKEYDYLKNLSKIDQIDFKTLGSEIPYFWSKISERTDTANISNDSHKTQIFRDVLLSFGATSNSQHSKHIISRNLQDLPDLGDGCLNAIIETLVIALQATLMSFSVAIQVDYAQDIARQLVVLLGPDQTKNIIEMAVSNLPPGTPLTEAVGDPAAVADFIQSVADGTLVGLALSADQILAIVLDRVDNLDTMDEISLGADLLTALLGGVKDLDEPIADSGLQDDTTNTIDGLDANCPFIQSTGGTDFPTASPTASPTPARQEEVDDGGDNGGGGVFGFLQGLCFSSYNVVDVKNKGIISMNELQIGDYVKAANNDHYTRVISFAHRDETSAATYLQIHTNNDKYSLPLEISHDHMIKKADKTIVRAKDLDVGDVLDGDLHIINIETVKRIGLYAPVTNAGTIQVSGLTASSYVALYQGLPAAAQHHVAHAFYAPIRMLCKISLDSFCMNEQYTDGLPNFLMTLKLLALKVTRQHMLFQIVTTILAALIVACLYVTEHSFMLGSFTLFLVLITGFTMLKTGKKTGKFLRQ